jgi:haloalkane dehalogenase
MKVLRTPESCFEDLPGYGFEPHYVEVPTGDAVGESLRVHYLDEGPGAGPDAAVAWKASAETVLLMHGEPSWSYLYRKMIPALCSAGLRVIAPDLVGFGRSDKPADRNDYTYARHVEWMRAALFDEVGITGITMFAQDWGGLVGLRLLAENPERFRRVVLANTGLPTGDGRMSEAFLAWQRFSQETPSLPVGRIVAGGCGRKLSDAEIAAYDAPFPDETLKEGARQFPALVPTSPDDPAAAANRHAWEVLEKLEVPILCAFADGDPITGGGDRVFLERAPGTASQPHRVIEGARHFLQEDQPEACVAAILDSISANPAG